MSEISGGKMLWARAVEVCNIRLLSLPSLLFLFDFCRTSIKCSPIEGSLTCSGAVKCSKWHHTFEECLEKIAVYDQAEDQAATPLVVTQYRA